MAGAKRLFVVAYLGIGLGRVYLTAFPIGLLGLAILTMLVDRRWSVPLAFLFSVAAAGTLTVLSACSCGSGSAAFLAQRAVQALVNGTALGVVG